MKINYIVLLPVIILFFCNHIFAQNNTDTSCDEIIKDNRHDNSTYDYISKKRIELKPGFSYNANGNNTFNALADPYMICEISNENIVENEYNQQNPYRHDKTLTVGSIAGQAGVSETGAATYQIPLFVSPGTAGMEPSVSIVYNSQSGNGVLGMGWHLSGLSSVSLAPNVYYLDGYNESVKYNFSNDYFKKERYQTRYAIDGTRLICNSGNYGEDGSYYRREADNFDSIVYSLNSFTVFSKNGSVALYGSNNNSKLRVASSSSNTMVCSWLLDRVTDNNGNYINYEYYELDNSFREKNIKKITYTGNEDADITPYNSIEFFYTLRDDNSVNYMGNTFFTQKVLLSKIIIKHKDEIIKEYTFKYSFSPYSRLSEIIESDKNGNRLNSTVIEWGETDYSLTIPTDNIITNVNERGSVQININQFTPLTGDFNGDGIYDFAYFYKNYNGNQEQVKGVSTLKVFLGNKDGTFTNSAGKTLTEDPILHEGRPTGNYTHNKYDIYTGDIDYDGKDEFILSSINDTVSYYYHLNDDNTFYTPRIPDTRLSGSYISGNFNGNGKPSFLEYIVEPDGYMLYMRYIDNENNEDNNTIRKKIVSDPLNKFITPSQNGVQKFLHAPKQNMDFDGDGISEILGIYESSDGLTLNAQIHEFNANTGMFECLQNNINIIDPHKYKNSLNDYYKFGDFHGDGKTDIMFRENKNYRAWKVHKSTGQYFTYDFTFISHEYATSNSNNYRMYVVDMNGDGKADIVEHFFEREGGIRDSLLIHLATGHGKFHTLRYSLNLNNIDTRDLLFGDFNGDGKTDIIYYDGRWKYRFVYFMENDNSNNVVRITDGFNLKSEFSYMPLSHINIKGEIKNDIFPLNSPMKLVTEFSQSNGLNDGKSITNYQYKEGEVHVKGKGFLGFKELITFNESQNIYSRTINNFNYSHFTIGKKISETYTFYQRELISSDETTMLIKPTISGNCLAILPKESVSLNKMVSDDNITRSVYNYYNENDGYFIGNIESVETYHSGVFTVKNEIKSYSSNGSWCLSRPVEIVETRSQGSDFKIRTTMDYDINGNLISTLTDSYIPAGKFLIKNFTYDICGNITSESLTGIVDLETNQQIRSIYYEYDNLKRFPVKTTDMTGLSAKTSYDPLFGTVLTHTDTRGDITTYEYDNFGNLKKIFLPLGHITEIERKWENNMQDNLAYYIRTKSPGLPETTTWYDILGREVKSAGNFYDKILFTGKEYRADGMLYREKLPHFEGSGSINFAEYRYDKFRRLISGSSLGLTTSYSYFDSEFTTVYPDGISETRKTNPAGQLTHVRSNNGDITYSYNANGNPSVITAAGVRTTMEYDAYRNQTSLSDVNAGLTSYSYNSFGELIRQEDANGNIFRISYDNAGRIVSKVCVNDPQLSIEYLYYTAGKPKGLLRREQMSNNTYIEYEYDDYGKLLVLKEFINGETFTHRYSYDEFDNVKTYTYPSGYTIKNIYNEYGFLTGVTEEDDTPVWMLSGSETVNEMGQFLSYQLGFEHIDVSFEYDNHYRLKEHKAGSVFNYKYEFDHNTGNLLSREDVIFGLKETFEYDGLNRLVEWRPFNETSGKVINYNDNGNISFKSDVGSYLYDPEKIHAITKIENSEGNTMVSSLDQSIKYNALQKTSEITEGINNYKYEILYGADSERKLTKFYNSDVLKKTRYYSGLYEKEIDGEGNITEYNYIPTGDGVIGLYKKNSKARIIASITYLIKDHLGSVLCPITSYEDEYQKYSYDPWGNMRDPYTWEYYETPQEMRTVNRGYTGHEMLPEFGLINMNGRMYDPVIGRVLSPDNYVQDEFNAQNYNRYSYCYNNPLKYIDPSGNEIVFPWTRGGQFGSSNVVTDVAGNPIGPYGTINNFGENPYQQPWTGNNGVHVQASGVMIVMDILSNNRDYNPYKYLAPVNAQITSEPYGIIIEKDGSLSKYMHGPGYKYTEPYTDGILLNGSFFTKDKLNIVGIDEMAPEMDFTGFWGKLSYYLNEGNFNGYKYNLEGKAVGISPNMGMPPAVGVGGIGAVKGGYSATSTAVRSAIADRVGKKGFSEVGYQFQKHYGRGGTWGKVIPEGMKLNPSTFNKAGYLTFKEIWRGPGSFKNVGGFLEKRLIDGRGIRLQQNYKFKGFLD